MESFDIPVCEQYTVHDLYSFKHGNDSREYIESRIYFNHWFPRPIASISYKEMKEHCDKLLKTYIVRGGCGRTGKGKSKLPSPTSTLRKFAYFASAISYMTSKGIFLENHAIRMVSYLRTMKENPYEIKV